MLHSQESTYYRCNKRQTFAYLLEYTLARRVINMAMSLLQNGQKILWKPFLQKVKKKVKVKVTLVQALRLCTGRTVHRGSRGIALLRLCTGRTVHRGSRGIALLRLCTGRTAHRGSRGIALPFYDLGTRSGWGGQRHALAALYPWERPSTSCTGGWVGPRAGLDRYGKSHLPTGIRSPDRACPVWVILTCLLFWCHICVTMYGHFNTTKLFFNIHFIMFCVSWIKAHSNTATDLL